MSDTLHGIPIDHEWAWVILRLQHDGKRWFPLVSTIGRTRRDAIGAFESQSYGEGDYARLRRRGEARALQCRIEPCTFGEDRRKGVTP